MRVRLTEALLDRARVRDSAQGYLFDTVLPRFHVVVGRGGTQAFAVFLGSNYEKKRVSIGRRGDRMPDGSVLTVPRAREIARGLIREAREVSDLTKAERALMRALRHYFAIKARDRT